MFEGLKENICEMVPVCSVLDTMAHQRLVCSVCLFSTLWLGPQDNPVVKQAKNRQEMDISYLDLQGVSNGGPLVVGWGFQPGDPFEGVGIYTF